MRKIASLAARGESETRSCVQEARRDHYRTRSEFGSFLSKVKRSATGSQGSFTSSHAAK